MNRDLISILREVRGSAKPGTPATNGIWYELTQADKNGNAGIYGDILAKYGIVTESAGTFDQAIEILENLNVEVTTLPAGSNATSALINGKWYVGIPAGTDGTDGINGIDGVDGADGTNGVDGVDGKDGNDGLTPIISFSYNPATGDLGYNVVYSDQLPVNNVKEM